MQYLQAQRQFFQSIHVDQHLKREQRNRSDQCVGLPELLSMQQTTGMKTEETVERLTTMQWKIDRIEEKLAGINQTMLDLHSTLQLILHRRA